MGCGMTKPAVLAPAVNAEGTDNHHSPVDDATSPISNAAELDSSVGNVKPTERARSASPKSTASSVKSSTTSDSEEQDAQDYPIRITTKEDHDSPTNQSSIATEVKKGFVAFDIPLDGSQATLLDNVLKKPLPKRLRHLEPLGHAPQITTEMLMEKLEKAEEKRQKALARWKEQAARRREMAQRRSEQFGDHQVTSGSSTSQQSPSTSEQCNFPAKSDTTQEFKNNVSRASIEDKQSAGSQLAEILQMTGDMDNNTIIQTPSQPGCQYNNNMTVQRMESNIELDQMRLDQTQLDTNRTYLFDFPIYVRERSRLQVLPEEQENVNSDEENTAVKQEQRRISPGIFSTPQTVQPSNEVSDVCSSRLNRSGGI